MQPLSGPAFEQLVEALSDAFTLATLEEMARYRLPRKLSSIDTSGPFRAVVFRLVSQAERD